MISENNLFPNFSQDIRFSDIFNLDEIQRMQDLFSEATGVASLITNPDGTPLTKPSNFCRFCNLIRSTEQGMARCIGSDKTLGVNDSGSPEIVLRSCHNARLWDSGANIIVNGKLLANWLVGQVRDESLSADHIPELAEEIGVDPAELVRAFNEIPLMSVHKFEKIVRMLLTFVNELTQKAFSNLQLKIEIEQREKANSLLLKSEEKYRTIFETVQDVFYQIGFDGIITEVSPSIKYYSGLDREMLIGRSVYDFYQNVADRERFLQEIKAKGEIRDYELDLKVAGKLVHVSVNARVVSDNNGNPLCMEGIMRDISKRKNAENALRETELKFRNYINFAPHAVFVADETGKYIDANPAATNLLGYRLDELLTIEPTKLVQAESQQKFLQHLEIARETGYATDELTILRKDSEPKRVVVDTVKLSDKCFLGFVVDITDRKAAEEILKESEMHLKEMQQIAHLGNVSICVNSRNWRSSEMLNKIFGITEDFDFTYAGWKKIVHPDSEREIVDYFSNNRLRGKTLFDKKFRIIRQSDKALRWVHVIGKLKFDADNQPDRLVATVQDITERKQYTEALRQSEALYRTTLNASPDTIVVVEMDGRIRMVSPSGLILFGYDDESMVVGHNMFEYIEPDDVERAQSNTALMFQGYLGTIQYRMVRSSGDVFHAEINGDIIWDADNKPIGMVFLVRDITERKKVEMDLKQSQSQLKKFAAHLQSVREEERLMLAREIHDELGQILIAIKIDLGMNRQKVLKQIKGEMADELLADYDNLFGLVDNTIKTARKIMTDLRPEVLHLLGLVEAVKLYAANFQSRHKITCSFENNVREMNLNSQQTVALYRIVQESLSNVARHSKASEVKISLFQKDGMLALEIVDNGIGLDETKKTKHDSYGLIGMKERAFLLDGELSIKSEINNGVRLKLVMPGIA